MRLMASQRLGRCPRLTLVSLLATCVTVHLLVVLEYAFPLTDTDPSTCRAIDRAPLSPFHSQSQWREEASARPDCHCDRQFGNGFTERHSLCGSVARAALECYHSRDIVGTHCLGSNLVLDPMLVDMDRGGESIASVRWRDGDREYPRYLPGALQLDCAGHPRPVPESFTQHSDHLRRMLGSLSFTVTDSGGDGEVIYDEAVILTRYYYANLYHAVTDIYNVYQAMRMFGTTLLPQVLLVDGHSVGAMDELWTTLFADAVAVDSTTATASHTDLEHSERVRQIKHYDRKRISVGRAIIVSSGLEYGSALAEHVMERPSLACHSHPLVHEFSLWVQRQFGLTNTSTSDGRRHGLRRRELVSHMRDMFNDSISAHSSLPRVVFVTRRPYLAHPHVNLNRTERTLAHEMDTLHAIKQLLRGTANFYAMDFTQYSIRQQLALLTDSDVLMGLHGAALTHILFLPSHTVLFELMPAGYENRKFFHYLSVWSGHRYVIAHVARDSASASEDYVLNPRAIAAQIETIVGERTT